MKTQRLENVRTRPVYGAKPRRGRAVAKASQRGTSPAYVSPGGRVASQDSLLNRLSQKGNTDSPSSHSKSSVTGDRKMYFSKDAGSLQGVVYIVGGGADDRALVGSRLSERRVAVEFFDSGQEFLDGVRWDAPGAVVAALELADMPAFALVAAMRRRGRELPLILLAEQFDTACAVQALRLGVFDLFRAPAEVGELRARVCEALRVDTDRFMRRCLLMRFHAAVSALSARERQVMELVVAGAANKVIASDLGISEKTVEAHRGKVMRKMQVDSLAELVRVNVILEVGRREPESVWG